MEEREECDLKQFFATAGSNYLPQVQSKPRDFASPPLSEISVLEPLNCRKCKLGPEPCRKSKFVSNDWHRYERASIGLIEEEDGARLVVIRDAARGIVAGKSRTKKKSVGRLKVGGADLRPKERSFTGFVAYSRKSKSTGNVKNERFYRHTNEQTKSELATPVLLRGECLAVINLESTQPNYYTPEHEKILKLVVRMIAPTLDSLMTREGHRKPLPRALDQINESLNSLSPSLSIVGPPTLNLVTGIIANVLNSKSCTIWVLDENKNLIPRGAFGPHLRAASGAHRDYVHKPGWVGQHGKPLILDARSERNLKRIDPTLRWKGKYSESTRSNRAPEVYKL